MLWGISLNVQNFSSHNGPVSKAIQISKSFVVINVSFNKII